MALRALLFTCLLATAMAGEVSLVRRWKTTLEEFPMGYSSASFVIARNILYVSNGANVGNAVLQFDLEGNYLGELAGWYNFPVDLIVGGQGEDQVLLSAIGAKGDDNNLRFGMVMYNSSGEFFHGYHEGDTGLVRPYGLVREPGSDRVAVCDWGNNRTVMLEVDWEQGTVVEEEELAAPAYPFRLAITRDRMIVASNVCCEEWHLGMKAVHVYSRSSSPNQLVATIKDLPTGETLQEPGEVAVDEDSGLFLVSDTGLAKTLIFNMEGEYLGEMHGFGAPKTIAFHSGLLYSLTTEENVDLPGTADSFINVFTYSW